MGSAHVVNREQIYVSVSRPRIDAPESIPTMHRRDATVIEQAFMAVLGKFFRAVYLRGSLSTLSE